MGKHGAPELDDTPHHWQYRLGVTQILTPRWLLSANLEAIADDGYLGSPYRVARVFGAAVPERNPRTRTGRAVKLRLVGDLGARDAMHVDYRYYWDTWDIKAHTGELGYSRYFGAELARRLRSCATTARPTRCSTATTRTSETLYVSRNRQLSTFHDMGLGGRLSYTLRSVPGRYDLKLNGSYEYTRFNFKDFTDLRTAACTRYAANVIQVYLSATF